MVLVNDQKLKTKDLEQLFKTEVNKWKYLISFQLF
jgi:hypothetical protein